MQILKAIAVGADRNQVVLLKFVVAPEWTVRGSELERVYSCPLSGFYSQFIGVDRDVRRDSTRPGFTVGNAIHRGYNRAGRAALEGSDPDSTTHSYLEAVLEQWADDFAHLMTYDFVRPGQLFEQPVTAHSLIVQRSHERWGGAVDHVELLQERLFFSPTRGLSGKADRIVRRNGRTELYEVKTTSAASAEVDPISGMRVPGGIQALAYHEIVRGIEQAQPMTTIELFSPVGFELVELSQHPVVTRSGARLDPFDDRYVDLLAQNRNVAYLAASGLLTGYDRQLIDDVARQGQRLRALGGDFDLYAAYPPCQVCPAREQRICEDVRGQAPPPIRGIFRYAPEPLFGYWAWFHSQLKREEASIRQSLFHLAATPAAKLEEEEGITIGDLTLTGKLGGHAVFSRPFRIETRIREDDRVLITPAEALPGEISSIEGTVVRIGFDQVEVNLREQIPAGRYRIDQVGHIGRTDWQVTGLTDFLISSVRSAGVAGRQMAVDELPRLARVVLGFVPPRPDRNSVALSQPTHDLIGDSGDLNEAQILALQSAIALDSGEALLIQGPPGTGKTTFIAHLARRVLGQEFWREDIRPLLVLANTHRACNEVVAKIVSRFPDMAPYVVRVGKPLSGTEPSVLQQYLSERVGLREAIRSIDLLGNGLEKLVELARLGRFFHRQAGIFVATLAAARAPELRGLTFGTVIVDESGQATEPAVLQALRHLPDGYRGRLVLIGDHRQLPPIAADDTPAPAPPQPIASLGFQAGAGLKVSLFERLASRWPGDVITLTEQYRMNGPVCDLVSDVFYDGKLRPGTAEIAERRLQWQPPARHDALAGLFDPRHAIVLIDTSLDTGSAESVGHLGADESRDNDGEARIVTSVVGRYLEIHDSLEARSRASEIGVISAYRRQNTRIRQRLEQRLGGRAAAVRVDTVDRFQGGEKDLVILSLVASNPRGTIGKLQADWRRMNVAISRARLKLVIVGSRKTFEQPSDLSEDAAKAKYRRLFAEIDRKAGDGSAIIVPSELILDVP